MKSVSKRSRKSDLKTEVSQQQATEPPSQKPHTQPLSSSEDFHLLIAERAYALYAERNFQSGVALEDWLKAEREVLSQFQPV